VNLYRLLRITQDLYMVEDDRTFSIKHTSFLSKQGVLNLAQLFPEKSRVEKATFLHFLVLVTLPILSYPYQA
jgi:hypothetical protein